MRVLNESAIERVIITNSLPNSEIELGPKFKVLSIAQILADAIKRITANRSVSELFARDEEAAAAQTTGLQQPTLELPELTPAR